MNLPEAILIHKGEEQNPCLVVARLDKDECQDELSLSYQDAARALQEHRQFLNNLSTRRALCGNNPDAASAFPQTRVVLAYLTHNSVDVFLSVLAASTATEVDQAGSNPRTVAALINARWTVNEIVEALKLRDGNNDLIHCTVLIYDSDGDELEETSRLAAQKLSSPSPTDSSSRQVHHVKCVPLPNFARARMTSTTIDSNQNSSFEPLHTNPEEFPAYQSICSDDAVIVFTSGTTGGSKGVRLGHRALYVQCLAKLQEPCAYNKSTRLLANTVPFFHVGGLSSLLAVWLAGGTLVLPSTTTTKAPAFDPCTTLKALRKGLANTLVVVPAMLYALQQEQQHQQKHSAGHGSDVVYPAVQLILIGGQSAEASTLHFVRQTFPKARLVQTYACTEGASSLTFHDVTTTTDPVDADSTILSGDCVGTPPPHVDLRLFRLDPTTAAPDENDFITDPFVPGIIATRGPHVMNGYWSRTSSSVRHHPISQTNGEWMRTSDLGFWGNDLKKLYFHGRVTDSIRTGGETVLAAEVERCLRLHPDIAECAVFALPDRRFGETVACAIVPVDDKLRISDNSIIEQDLRSWCKQQGLAGYKRPRLVFRVDELPRNSSGKVLKFKLAELFVSRQRCHL